MPAPSSGSAPKNVVIMFMSFAPLNDGSKKHRLEAQFTGKGTAWIATNGKAVKGTWKKNSMTGTTRFFTKDGKPVTLTMGQTFVQVVSDRDEAHDQERQGSAPARRPPVADRPHPEPR